MELLWAILFVCTAQLTDCTAFRSPQPFKSATECRAALQTMGQELMARVPVGQGYQLLGHCGPKLGVDDVES